MTPDVTTAVKLTKLTHGCVRLEKDGRMLVLDPGGFSERDAANGADAILVTHEHPDHFDAGRLRTAMDADPATEIWTLRSVAEKISAARTQRNAGTQTRGANREGSKPRRYRLPEGYQGPFRVFARGRTFALAHRNNP